MNGSQCWGCYDSQVVPLNEGEIRYVNEIVCNEFNKTLRLLYDLRMKVQSVKKLFAKEFKKKIYKMIYDIKIPVKKEYQNLSVMTFIGVYEVGYKSNLIGREYDLSILVKSKNCLERLMYLNEISSLLNDDRSIFSFTLKKKILRKLDEIEDMVKGIKCDEYVM